LDEKEGEQAEVLNKRQGLLMLETVLESSGKKLLLEEMRRYTLQESCRKLAEKEEQWYL